MTDCEDAFDRLLNSSKPSEVAISTQQTSIEENQDSDSEDEVNRTARIKPSVLDGSSSDEEIPVVFKPILNIKSEQDKVDVQSDDEEVEISRNTKKRIMKVLDDSDDEPGGSPRSRNENMDEILPSNGQDDLNGGNSDSDSSSVSNRSARSSKSGSSRSGSSRSSSGENSGGDSEEEISIEAIKSKIKSKHSASAPKVTKILPDIDGSDPGNKGRLKPKKEKAPSRKAKEAALAEIHSETQRMIRERQISLPYHKPKQRSLADFLNRRKLAPAVRLKTSSDELAKVWKHVEEREKTAEHFYRSESEEEGESIISNERQNADSGEAIPLQENSEAVLKKVDEVPGESEEVPEGSRNEDPQTMDTEDFPSLRLSELTAEATDSINISTLGNVEASDENSVSLTVHTSDLVNVAAESDEVDKEDKNVEEPVENSENVHSSVIEESSLSTNHSSLSEKINSMNLPIPKCPKIIGAPDELIDLDELDRKPGAFGLMQRFIKHAQLKTKPVKQQNISIVTSEVDDCGEIINLTEETIKVKRKDEPKPGEKLVVLKTTLQQKMAETREQQLAKKLEEYKLYEEEFYGVTGLGDGEEELFSDDDCKGKEKDDELCETEVDKEEDDIDNPFVENEAEDSEDDDCADDDEKEGNEDDVSGNEETASVLLGDGSDEESQVGSDEDHTNPVSEDEENDVVAEPSVPSAIKDLAGTQSTEPIGESQLMALCSGNFSNSAIDLKLLETSSEALQELKDSQQEEDRDSVDPKPSNRNLLDSDDEELVLPNKQKSKKRKLSFSDDEDDAEGKNNLDDDPIKLTLNDESNTEQHEDEESDEDGENLNDDVVEEDENDEEVMLAKKLSKGFLEKEAELSESEWGSDDEDEKGLDQYEEEEGDKDKISQRRLQKELGKIHMREIQAEDNREIRILQELLLEDGDLHSDGPKRQRQFRWYNQDEGDASEKRPLDLGENPNENDDDDEEQWRRQRLERENYLRKKKIDNLEAEIIESPVNFNDTRKGVKVTPKIIPITNKSPDPKSNFSIFSKRGSFLGRGEKMLTKLAEITNNAGSKESALGNSRNNRNMVFSVVSPPKERQAEDLKTEPPIKRKGDFLATSVVKKIKFSSKGVTTKVSALDQLKLFE